MTKLVIAPHADDEVLGCFSMLRGSHVLYISTIESLCPKDKEHRISTRKKFKEVESVMEFCNISGFKISNCTKVNDFEKDKYLIIQAIEDRINTIKPDLVLIPNPSINQDHKTVYEACLVALRHHDVNHFVKNVLIYECPQSFLWGNRLVCDFYKTVDIGSKVQCYQQCHPSQVREYRSPGLLMEMASIRGHEANLVHAEGFKTVRFVEDS